MTQPYFNNIENQLVKPVVGVPSRPHQSEFRFDFSNRNFLFYENIELALNIFRK